MAKRVYLHEACNALAIDSATLYRWLRRADIQAQTDEIDKRKRYITQADVRTLARLHGKQPSSIYHADTTQISDKDEQIEELESKLTALFDSKLAEFDSKQAELSQRIDEIEKNIARLHHFDAIETLIESAEMRLEALEQAIKELQAKDRTRIHRPPKPTYTTETPQPTTSTTIPALPDGWVPIADFFEQHGIKESTARRRDEWDYVRTGKWKTEDGRTVKNVLDQEGQAAFLNEFGTQS